MVSSDRRVIQIFFMIISYLKGIILRYYIMLFFDGFAEYERIHMKYSIGLCNYIKYTDLERTQNLYYFYDLRHCGMND